MSDSHGERKHTKAEMFAFMQACHLRFSTALDDLIRTAKVPIYGVMNSLIAFAGEAAAQAGMPREDFLKESADAYDEAMKIVENQPS
jgi:hypothetical protein